MPRTVLADLFSRKVLHMVPAVLPWSIPEQSDLEHEFLLVVVPLPDKAVKDSVNRFTCR